VKVVLAGEARHAGSFLARQAVEEDVPGGQRLVERRAGPGGGKVEGVHLARLRRAFADPGRGGARPRGVGVADVEVDVEVSDFPQQQAHGASHAAGAGDDDLMFLAHERAILFRLSPWSRLRIRSREGSQTGVQRRQNPASGGNAAC
jgi:hypothetical protein